MRRRPPAGSSGFIAIDAMVALLIISVTMILSLQAAETAERVAVTANEYRRAQALLSYLLDFGPRSFTSASGQTDGFSWSLVTQITGADRPIAVCRRAVSMTYAASGRAYQAATLDICPDSPAA